jgi:hypothetical protein
MHEHPLKSPTDAKIMHTGEQHFYLWTVTDPMTKRRRRLGYRMTETAARERFGDDAVKVEGSLEVRTSTGQTSDFLRSAPPQRPAEE